MKTKTRTNRRQVSVQLRQYIRITRKVAEGARTEGIGGEELADALDQRVADAIACLPREERIRIVMEEDKD